MNAEISLWTPEKGTDGLNIGEIELRSIRDATGVGSINCIEIVEISASFSPLLFEALAPIAIATSVESDSKILSLVPRVEWRDLDSDKQSYKTGVILG